MIFIKHKSKRYGLRTSQILEYYLTDPQLDHKYLTLHIKTQSYDIDIQFDCGENAEKAFDGITAIIVNGGTATIEA